MKTVYPSFKAALAGVVAILSLCAPLAHAEFSRAYLDQQTLQTAAANGIDIAYRSVGADNRPTVVMIMGLGASHIVWGRQYGQRPGASRLSGAAAGQS